MIPADSSLLVPLDAKSVSTASADVDLTTLWTDQPWARAIWNGAASAADIAVTTTSGSSITYKNVPSGGRIFGLFKTLVKTGTTATSMIAEK